MSEEKTNEKTRMPNSVRRTGLELFRRIRNHLITENIIASNGVVRSRYEKSDKKQSRRAE